MMNEKLQEQIDLLKTQNYNLSEQLRATQYLLEESMKQTEFFRIELESKTKECQSLRTQMSLLPGQAITSTNIK